MGKCNLFSPVSRPTGNFLLFSQYSEDLTKSAFSEDYYRVVPSKYVLVNLNTSNLLDDVKFSEYFQNYYENACSIMRVNQNVEWTPECATDMFWKSLIKASLISAPVMDPNHYGVYHSPEIMHVGDINITSSKEVDGINYSEIYVEVPQNSKRQTFDFTHFSTDMSRTVQYPNDYIYGYPDDEYPTAGTEDWPSNKISGPSLIQYYDDTVIVGYGADTHTEYLYGLRTNNDFYFDPEPVSELDDESYEFNCVVVLYDIYKRGVEDQIEYISHKNIPMGMYITGKPERGDIQNDVKIWISNDDIYQQGTSYGFRICTRYLSTTNSLYIVDSTIEDTEELYDQYSSLMVKMGQSQNIMDDIVSQMSDYQNNISGHLANIKNYKVNVPYLRNIGGIDYWFVNGRNLGVAAYQTSLVWENY